MEIAKLYKQFIDAGAKCRLWKDRRIYFNEGGSSLYFEIRSGDLHFNFEHRGGFGAPDPLGLARPLLFLGMADSILKLGIELPALKQKRDRMRKQFQSHKFEF